MTHYKSILVTTDLSEASFTGLREAALLAGELGSRITLLYVVEDTMPPLMPGASVIEWRRILQEHRETAQAQLEACAEKHFRDLEHHAEIRVGRAVETILETAANTEADLIVMASRSQGPIGQLLLGSTTDRVLRQASCPVLVVHRQEADS
jgi:nucleotide-binding universal stress UspA family protein